MKLPKVFTDLIDQRLKEMPPAVAERTLRLALRIIGNRDKITYLLGIADECEFLRRGTELKRAKKQIPLLRAQCRALEAEKPDAKTWTSAEVKGYRAYHSALRTHIKAVARMRELLARQPLSSLEEEYKSRHPGVADPLPGPPPQAGAGDESEVSA
jgi:hypothetical protein